MDRSSQLLSFFSSDTKTNSKKLNETDTWTSKRVSAYVGHTFPDFIEGWNRTVYKRVGYGLTGTTLIVTGVTAFSLSVIGDLSTWTGLSLIGSFTPAGFLGIITGFYWKIGLRDIRQTQHAVRRNYPLLGNLRYILETVSAKRK